jgi:hypothetical protein
MATTPIFSGAISYDVNVLEFDLATALIDKN